MDSSRNEITGCKVVRFIQKVTEEIDGQEDSYNTIQESRATQLLIVSKVLIISHPDSTNLQTN